tara:strand:+ start:547 stop:2316 length:1770 start_codon:yes stop_codon:yes gene_type:complete
MAIPFLNNINLSDNQLQNAKLHVTGSAPTAAAGQIYFNSSDNKAKYYNGSAWVDIVASTGGTVTNVSSLTTSQLSVADGSTVPKLSIITAAVSNGGSALATGDQIYDFVTAALPTVGNGTLTVQGTGVLGGTGTFTANQSGNTTIDVTHDAQSQSNTTPSVSLSHGGTFTALSSNVGVNSSGHVTGQTLTTFTLPTDGLGVETVTSGNTNTITIGGTSADPTVAANTAAVVNGGASLATGDQIYDFVTGQIANIPSGLSFEGSWNANTDTPDLSGLSPENGQFWIVSVAGSTNLDGITDWKVGDWAIYVSTGAGTDGWQKVDNTSTLSGAGAAGQLTYWTGSANVAGDAGLTYNAATDALTVGGAITAGGVMTAPGGNSGEWNTGYDNMITGFSDSGSSTITLTLTQQDGGTLTTSFANPQGTGDGSVTGVTGVSPIAVTSSITTPEVSIATATGSAIGAGNVAPGEGIDVSYSGGTATVSGENSSASNKGIVIVAPGNDISVSYASGTATVSSAAQENNTYAVTITDTVTITHGLSSKDVIIQLFDVTSGETVYADVERVDTAPYDTATVTFATTPTNSIRVLVQKIG